VKAGASCKKIGSTTVISGKKYTCIKSGKKLIWNKGIKIQKRVETKSEIPISTTLSNSGSTSTPSQALDPKYPKQGDSCPNKSPDVIGYDQQGLFVDLMCNEFDNRYFPRPENLGAFKVDPKTGVRIKGEMQGTQQVIEWKEPKDISSTNLSTITPRSELADLNLCKIKDAAADGMSLAVNQKHFVSGFGLYEERAPLTRSPVIQFVTVDFADLPGKRRPTEDLKPITDFLGKYWKSQTTNGIELEFRIPEKYIRMPQNVVDYGMNVDFFSGKWKSTSAFDYVRAALKVVDSQIDFTNVDVIAIVVPAEVKRDQIAAFVAESSEKAAGQGFDTAEKRIYNTLIMAGPTNTPDFELLNWAHELGHNFGLTDIRNTQNVAAQDSSDLGIYDLMNSMLAPELLAWNRFIIGILNDDQVRCVNSGITTHLIKPVEMNTKENKLVVIPTGKYQAIAVETRRAIGFDATMGSKSEGVLVYTIDTTIPYNLSPMKLVPRVGSTDTVWRRDSALKLGDSLTVQGWKISVIESGDFGDVVKVEKTS
jgi:M6 family metalloprotease-like protein